MYFSFSSSAAWPTALNQRCWVFRFACVPKRAWNLQDFFVFVYCISCLLYYSLSFGHLQIKSCLPCFVLFVFLSNVFWDVWRAHGKQLEGSPFFSGMTGLVGPVQDCADSQTCQEWIFSSGFTGLVWIYHFALCPLGVWLPILSRNFLWQISCGKLESKMWIASVFFVWPTSSAFW